MWIKKEEEEEKPQVKYALLKFPRDIMYYDTKLGTKKENSYF